MVTRRSKSENSPIWPPLPVPVRLELVFEATPASGTDVGFIAVGASVFAAVEVGVKHSTTYMARNLRAGAVRANSLPGLELAESGAVDAEPRRSQEGDHAAIELALVYVERRDAAVLARGRFVLTPQLQDLLGNIRETFRGRGVVATGRHRRGIVRQ